MAGFGWALAHGYDVVVEMDADGSHAPEQLPRMLEALETPFAAANVPVTHRGVAQEFSVVSVHVPPGDPRSTVDWPSAAEDTWRTRASSRSRAAARAPRVPPAEISVIVSPGSPERARGR